VSNGRDAISVVTEFMVSVRLQDSNRRDVISVVTEFVVSVRLQVSNRLEPQYHRARHVFSKTSNHGNRELCRYADDVTQQNLLTENPKTSNEQAGIRK
jgi:hypothetical protein